MTPALAPFPATQGPPILALLVASIFFAMAETAITALWPWKVREIAEAEGEESPFAMLKRDITRFLTTILIGTTVCHIFAATLITELAGSVYGAKGVAVGVGLYTGVNLLFCEIIPKSLAVQHSAAVARLCVQPIALLSVVLYPVGKAVTLLSQQLLRLLPLPPSEQSLVTTEELKLVLGGAEDSGALAETNRALIENVLELEGRTVGQVMTPYAKVVAVAASSSLLGLRGLWLDHQLSRVPVHADGADARTVVGVLNVKQALLGCDYEGDVAAQLAASKASAHMKPAYMVSEQASASVQSDDGLRGAGGGAGRFFRHAAVTSKALRSLPSPPLPPLRVFAPLFHPRRPSSTSSGTCATARSTSPSPSGPAATSRGSSRSRTSWRRSLASCRRTKGRGTCGGRPRGGRRRRSPCRWRPRPRGRGGTREGGWPRRHAGAPPSSSIGGFQS